jgi:hypothetical protein
MKKFRKFIWCGIVAVAIGGGIVFNVSLNSQNGLFTVVNTNVEALSSGESGKPGDKCYAGSFNSSVPEARYCYNHCASMEPVNTNIQTCI